MKKILDNPKFIERLSQVATRKNMNFRDVYDEAAGYLTKMESVRNPIVSDVTYRAVEMALGRAYKPEIDIRDEEVKKLAKLMRKHPVAFVMTHKTYIDMFVLGLALLQRGLPSPFIFGGDNLDFPIVSQLGHRMGIIFIKRSFKQNEIYKITLRYYIQSLVDKRQHFMWAIEGTRSRTGKLVWPKMGILKYIADASAESTEEVKFVPVSVVYDLIPDVKDITAELRGKNKKREDPRWLMQYIKKFDANYGRISIRFDEPVEPEQHKNAIANVPVIDEWNTVQSQKLPRFAFELVHSINRITPVTSTSLICTILLSKFALTKKALLLEVHALQGLIRNHAPEVLIDDKESLGISLQKGINLLLQSGIIRRHGAGISTQYAIAKNQFLAATYYSNMAAHHLYHRAFIELALIAVADVDAAERQEAFWKEIMALRNLFKFEFFYSKKPIFADEIERELAAVDKDWSRLWSATSQEIYDTLAKQEIHIANVLLSAYVDAYRVAARTLMNYPITSVLEESKFLKDCQFVGEGMHWQGVIQRMDYVSKPFLVNAIRLFKNLKITSHSPGINKDKLEALQDSLADIAERIGIVKNMVVEQENAHHEALTSEGHKQLALMQKKAPMPHVQDILEGPRGSHIAAFFDLDRTLIKGYSARKFLEHRLWSGQMKYKELLAQISSAIVFALTNSDFEAFMRVASRGLKGMSEDEFLEFGEEVYLKYIAEAIYPEARALVEAHLAMGHTVAIVSAATPYQVNPVARDLGVEHVMCTRLDVKEGRFSGDVITPVCWGEGKSDAAQVLTKKFDLDLGKSYFYTDSIVDLPLLEIVGNPRPTNPDRELSALSFQSGWTSYKFDDSERPTWEALLRTGAAFGSVLPLTVTAFLTGATTQMSRKSGVNAMMATFGDIGTAMLGIKLAVKGKKNLWKQRPAVFIFNHQSSADVFINAKLLRKDVVAIAKKELKSSPLGPLFMAAGVVFIDRANREKAIEALNPVVDALRDGYSVAIAPEGTRSYDYALGEFKKGAFHIAMQAGVPIVPIVIQNAHDVRPRGAKLFRPTVVEITVLDPIDTKDWTKDNMDDKITNIRNMYLETLGQMPKISI